MKVKTQLTYAEHLEYLLNEIGYEKVINIIPCAECNTTRFMVIYRVNEEEQG